MNKKAIIDSIKKVREVSPKRKFPQTFDLIINLQNIDVKNPDQKVDLFVQLHYPKGKKPKVCALVGPEMETKAKPLFDQVILKEEFSTYGKNKKAAKKLASSYDYFIAQANLMAEIATAFGKVFGPKGKMPNPKAGCVVPPTIDLKPIANRLEFTARATTKEEPIVKTAVGTENMKDEEIADNAFTVFNAVLHAVPNEIHNIKSMFLKLSMGPVIQITNKGPVFKENPKKPKEVKK